jgi:dihydrofolate reductase
MNTTIALDTNILIALGEKNPEITEKIKKVRELGFELLIPPTV